MHSLTAIVLSHFILDLRSSNTSSHSPTQTSRNSSVRFASAIEENFNGPLDASWATGEEVDLEDEDIQNYEAANDTQEAE